MIPVKGLVTRPKQTLGSRIAKSQSIWHSKGSTQVA